MSYLVLKLSTTLSPLYQNVILPRNLLLILIVFLMKGQNDVSSLMIRTASPAI